MKHKDGLDIAALLLLLLVAIAAMVVPVALTQPALLAVPAVLVLIALCVVLYQRRRLRAFLARQLCSTDFENSRIQYSLANLPIPTVLVNDGRILWYNQYFKQDVLNDYDAVTRPVNRVLPELDLAVCSRPHGQDLKVGERRFTAYAGSAKGSRGASLVYLINDTLYKETLDEYNESRPACLIIVIDSYDELFDDMKDSEQAKELEAINSLLEKYIGRSTGFLRKVTNSRYIAVVEERDVRWMLAERFDILDKVRALHPGGLTTLSIGVGHGGKTLQECHQMARESIDIALGRGGDQAAVKTVDGFEFYGGISHGVEKRSHVRSRIIANALCDLIKRSDSVIIMGHRMSDLDAVGSAIGVLRICKMCDVPAVIAINSEATLAGPLLKTFLDAGEGHDFIAPDQTLDVITPNTLLIVVDTYQKRLLESQQIYEKCKRVVVIDHHRMAVGHIDNPTLIYHEPYASSASELVCELLQFMPAQNNITQLEAQALLSGIMLDTRSFALHVGVRTFEGFGAGRDKVAVDLRGHNGDDRAHGSADHRSGDTDLGGKRDARGSSCGAGDDLGNGNVIEQALFGRDGHGLSDGMVLVHAVVERCRRHDARARRVGVLGCHTGSSRRKSASFHSAIRVPTRCESYVTFSRYHQLIKLSLIHI